MALAAWFLFSAYSDGRNPVSFIGISKPDFALSSHLSFPLMLKCFCISMLEWKSLYILLSCLSWFQMHALYLARDNIYESAVRTKWKTVPEIKSKAMEAWHMKKSQHCMFKIVGDQGFLLLLLLTYLGRQLVWTWVVNLRMNLAFKRCDQHSVSIFLGYSETSWYWITQT